MLGLMQTCGAGLGGGRECGSTDEVRPYPCGPRCSGHRPQPVNPDPDPARTLQGLRAAAGLRPVVTPTPSAGWAAIDSRAIASGRRRSNPEDVAAAKVEVAVQKARRHT